MKNYLKLRGAADLLKRAEESAGHNPFEPDWYVDTEHYGHTNGVEDAISLLRQKRKEILADLSD